MVIMHAPADTLTTPDPRPPSPDSRASLSHQRRRQANTGWSLSEQQLRPVQCTAYMGVGSTGVMSAIGEGPVLDAGNAGPTQLNGDGIGPGVSRDPVHWCRHRACVRSARSTPWVLSQEKDWCRHRSCGQHGITRDRTCRAPRGAAWGVSKRHRGGVGWQVRQ